ncbi:MAG TPA: hypothetical protein VFE14_08455, partial [Micromonosporaceae bacterium]|nr:hypothetical protein [Micromonosporaceae bacterium]
TDAIGRQQEEAARAWASRQVVEYVPDASSAKMIRLWPGWYLVRWPYGGGGRYFPPEDPLRRAIRRLLRAVPIGPIRVHD